MLVLGLNRDLNRISYCTLCEGIYLTVSVSSKGESDVGVAKSKLKGHSRSAPEYRPVDDESHLWMIPLVDAAPPLRLLIHGNCSRPC